jgi:hypothetical protein
VFREHRLAGSSDSVFYMSMGVLCEAHICDESNLVPKTTIHLQACTSAWCMHSTMEAPAAQCSAYQSSRPHSTMQCILAHQLQRFSLACSRAMDERGGDTGRTRGAPRFPTEALGFISLPASAAPPAGSLLVSAWGVPAAGPPVALPPPAELTDFRVKRNTGSEEGSGSERLCCCRS